MLIRRWKRTARIQTGVSSRHRARSDPRLTSDDDKHNHDGTLRDGRLVPLGVLGEEEEGTEEDLLDVETDKDLGTGYQRGSRGFSKGAKRTCPIARGKKSPPVSPAWGMSKTKRNRYLYVNQ